MAGKKRNGGKGTERPRVEKERHRGVKEGAREKERGVERSYGRFAACRVVVACRASSAERRCRFSVSPRRSC